MEMKIITEAYEVLDVLRTLQKLNLLPVPLDLEKFRDILKSVRVVPLDDVRVDGLKRSAANYPKELLLEIKSADFEKNKDVIEDFFQMVTHEFMPLFGPKDPGYIYSKDIRKAAIARGLLKNRAGKKLAPTLLFEEGLDDDDHRMTWDEAAHACGIQKLVHAREYYFVYCVYYERDHQEFVLEPVADRFQTLLRDHYNRTTFETNQYYWHSIWTTRTESTYGLRVFGLGAPSELEWKVVASSRGLVDGLIDRTFDDERTALEACRRRMITEAELGSTLLDRARCRMPRQDDGRYYYEIVTQNPLIQN